LGLVFDELQNVVQGKIGFFVVEGKEDLRHKRQILRRVYRQAKIRHKLGRTGNDLFDGKKLGMLIKVGRDVFALVRSGRRRLRPVLMTSLAAALGMLPLAYGIGSGADMLKPLAIAVMGALAISVLLSLVATPTVFRAIRRRA